MTETAYRFHSIEADGPWTSPPFSPAERRHIVQGVIGGFIMGRPRWAEDLDGNFIYGLDAKGKEVKAAPAYAPKPTPRRRGKNKPKDTVQHATRKKSPAQLDREIAEALSKSRGSTAHATMSPTRVDPSKLRVGQRFDYIGHVYEITKIGRDKARTVQIARRSKDAFGKEFLIDHRSFPAQHFDRQHLRPL